jgi:hypothetical protein
MADLFHLEGGYSTSPNTGAEASADPQVCAHIDERLSLDNKTTNNVVLDDDDPVDVDLGGITNVNVLIMRTQGGKATARITSADGKTQAVPVDPFFALISRSVAVTAVDLTRVKGVATTVKVFMGEKPA